MKFFFKVTWERSDGEKDGSYYYQSTSISALISYFADIGVAVGFVVEVKRVSRLPKGALLYKGCYE